MSGPGPKDIATQALEAVANAIEAPFVKAESLVALSITAAVEKAHAAERAVIDKMHVAETDAAHAIDNVKNYVDALTARFPIAAPAAVKLRATLAEFADAIGGAR